MAKFYFKYGVMNSSKTANLLMVAYNYESQGRHILCLKSSLDNRWNTDNTLKEGVIESRALPNSHKCELIDSHENLYNRVKQYNNENISKYSSELSAILIDEAQFLVPEQVRQLAIVVEKLKIDVLCFGLKNTYIDGELFKGTAALLYYADNIQEIKTICKYCNRKATMNLRIVDGKAVYSGDDIIIGDVNGSGDTYAQVCFHHYLNPPAPIIGINNKILTKQNYNDKFNYMINYQNIDKYYHKTSEIAKQNLTFTLAPTLKERSDALKIKYIAFGPICIDVIEYNKKRTKKLNNIERDVEDKSKTLLGPLNITEAIIEFLYNFFENDTQTAFNLLKNGSCNYIKFFENKEEFDNSFKSFCTDETKLKGTLILPDGKYAYINNKTKDSLDFYHSVLAGFSTKVNNIEVGFYVER